MCKKNARILNAWTEVANLAALRQWRGTVLTSNERGLTLRWICTTGAGLVRTQGEVPKGGGSGAQGYVRRCNKRCQMQCEFLSDMDKYPCWGRTGRGAEVKIPKSAAKPNLCPCTLPVHHDTVERGPIELRNVLGHEWYVSGIQARHWEARQPARE